MQTISAGNIAGIDISHYQGQIDWQVIKDRQQVGVVSIKATEGATYIDPALQANVQGAKSIGLPIQLYHVARPNQTSAQDEAANFIKALKAFGFDLLPALDLEFPYDPVMDKATLIQWVHDFMGTVKQAIGQDIVLYTGKWFADYYNDFDGQFASYPLWVAHYVDSYDNVPADFGGWTQWLGWQHTDKGNVAGIQGPVDLDIIYNLDAIRFKTEPAKPEYLLSVEDANSAISLIHSAYELPWITDDQKNDMHRLANAYRIASGQQPT